MHIDVVHACRLLAIVSKNSTLFLRALLRTRFGHPSGKINKIGGAICARAVDRAHSRKNRAISHITVTFDLWDLLLCDAAQVATYLEVDDPV